MRLLGRLVLGNGDDEVEIEGPEFGHEEEGRMSTGLIYKHWVQVGEEEVEVKVVFWPQTYDRCEVTLSGNAEVVVEDLKIAH